MTKTKINFRLEPDRKSKRVIGCLDNKTGLVTNAKDNKVRTLKEIQEYDEPGFFETHHNGKMIQKKGRFLGLF